MNITFIVPGLNLSGGLRVISIYAQLLTEKGHRVSVVSPGAKKPTLKQRIKSVLNWNSYVFKSNFNSAFFNNAEYDINVLETHREITADDIPDGDVVIATFWNTAEWVSKLPKSKGEKIYFIQHYEAHPWMPIERVKATLLLPLKKIVVAEWLAELLKNDFKQKDVVVVPNAVDHELFYSTSRHKQAEPCFGMMYSNRTYKGSGHALTCFKAIKNQYPNAKLIAFGHERFDEVEALGLDIEYYSNPEQQQLRMIYSSCDAWLFTSTVEGYGLPILEALACKTPVIATKVGAAPELLASGGGKLVDVNDQDQLISAMNDFCTTSPEQWLQISELAYKEAISHKWSVSVNLFEQALLGKHL